MNHSWCLGVVSYSCGEFVGGRDEGGGERHAGHSQEGSGDAGALAGF